MYTIHCYYSYQALTILGVVVQLMYQLQHLLWLVISTFMRFSFKTVTHNDTN